MNVATLKISNPVIFEIHSKSCVRTFGSAAIPDHPHILLSVPPLLESGYRNRVHSDARNDLGILRILQEMNIMREVTVEHRYHHAITEPSEFSKWY